MTAQARTRSRPSLHRAPLLPRSRGGQTPVAQYSTATPPQPAFCDWLHCPSYELDSSVWSGWWDGSSSISQLFGVWENFAGLNGPHTGIDIGLKSGTALKAGEHATVEKVGWDPNGYGLHLILRLDDGAEVLLGHMKDSAVQVGQEVSAGTVLGHSDDTGASTAAHLHYEVRVGGVAVNPWAWLLRSLPGVAQGTTTAPAAPDTKAPTWSWRDLFTSHDPCSPPADEPGVLKMVDFLACGTTWWRAAFLILGAAMVVTGLVLYVRPDAPQQIASAAAAGAA